MSIVTTENIAIACVLSTLAYVFCCGKQDQKVQRAARSSLNSITMLRQEQKNRRNNEYLRYLTPLQYPEIKARIDSNMELKERAYNLTPERFAVIKYKGQEFKGPIDEEFIAGFPWLKRQEDLGVLECRENLDFARRNPRYRDSN